MSGSPVSHSALTDAFLRGCERSELRPSDGPVVIGMSAGCDSTTLGHLLHDAGFDLIVVHVNYGLRSESAAEEAFVRRWAVERDLPLVIHHPDQQAPTAGIQAWARDQRYRCFRDVALEYGANSVVVAHHADDQLETILINLERGTGPAGLIGMRNRRPLAPGDACGVARPLLRVTRADLVRHAREAGWAWLEDASNAEADYTRNALRQELAVMDSADYAALREAAIALSDRMQSVYTALMVGLHAIEDEESGHLPDAELSGLPSWVERWIILEWLSLHAESLPRRNTVAEEVLSLRSSQAGRKTVFDGVIVWRERDGLRITSSEEADASDPAWIDVTMPHLGKRSRIPAGEHVLDLERPTEVDAETTIQQLETGPDRSILMMDSSRIKGSLRIRAWQEGDRFRPLGMRGTKKVKSFLTDRKVPASERASVRLLVDEDGILCVLGYGQDERTRVTTTTTEPIIVRWQRATDLVSS